MKNKGQFKRGYTYRSPKPYWSKDWLNNEYTTLKKSAIQIANEQGCKENNILYFLSKHKIHRRTASEVRKIKKWTLSGKQNGMFGKTGIKNPNWRGGYSAERQSKYARSFWKELAKAILKRDQYQCQECGAGHTKGDKLQIHHIKQWSCYPELRFDENNLITLCKECHKMKHSRRK